MEILIPLIIIAAIVMVLAAKTIRIVPQATVLIIERLGKFDRVATSGLNIVTPFVDKPRSVFWSGMRSGMTSIDMREQFIDLPPQPVITRDNVTITCDSVVYWQVLDPIKAVYEVNDLAGSMIQLTITAMRNVVGNLDLDHALTSRDTINNNLRVALDEATDKWGVKVTPEDVRITMEKQMTAERNRRAVVLQADGEKSAAITRAEGEKQAAVTRAEGDKQSAILQAQGAAEARLTAATAEAESLRQIAEGISGGNPAHYMIMMKYIESLREMSKSNNAKVIFMPVETSSLLSSIGAFKEVFGGGEIDSGATPVQRLRPPMEEKR
jgi:regulator of protease activity HflC (stomatin/prohibitin superfamily)